MTDNEIIKALECCADNTEGKCRECPFHKLKISCIDGLERNALDLINRQKAEIEDKAEKLRKVLPIVAELKAEAIKEFAERVTSEDVVVNGLVWTGDIIKIYKEMTEEQK